MQCYSVPDSVHVPDFDEAFVDGKYDREKDDAIHQAFFDALKAKLIELGFTGKLTGEIVRYQRGDGYAQYMVMDAPRNMGLAHLPIHDAWSIDAAHMRGLRKSDIVEQLDADKRLAALFARKD